MVPPNFRHVSPGGHGVALQSWLEVSEQRYTCLERGLYRFEAGRFEAELPVDADGLVLDYPGLFRRI